MTIEDREERSQWSRYCFMWSRVVLSRSITLILGVFSVVYTIQQDHLARIYREQDQYDNTQIRQQMIYDSYMDQMSQLFLSKTNLTSVDTKLHLRIKTLNTLRYVSLHQQYEIILFLYQITVLRADHMDLLIDLSEAQLDSVSFRPPCSFSR